MAVSTCAQGRHRSRPGAAALRHGDEQLTEAQLEVGLAHENLQQLFLRRGCLGGLFFLGLFR